MNEALQQAHLTNSQTAEPSHAGGGGNYQIFWLFS